MTTTTGTEAQQDYYQNWVCGKCGTSLELSTITPELKEVCSRCGTEVRYPGDED